jgi:glycosyltransferase involved in cell wall biosynthesis
MDEKTQKPLIGIGMPVYNGAAYLRQTLDSVVEQTVQDWELIICDNASFDETPDICREYAARDGRIRYIRQEQNVGAHPNYNRCFRESRGMYFKWAAHDDVLCPGFLEGCIASIEADPAAVLTQSHLRYIDETGNQLGVYDSALVGALDEDPIRRFAAIVLQRHPCYELMGLLRRDALERTRLLGSFHGADRVLLAELALLGRFRHVAEPLLKVRDHPNRYTRAKTRPSDRAKWHDSSLTARFSFPTWRLYREYWTVVQRGSAAPPVRLRASLVLCQWWVHNFNAMRMAVDLLAIPFPGIVAWSEGFKQRVFSPAPGAGDARRDA